MDGRRRIALVLKFEDRSHMIDVCVGADNLLQCQPMSIQPGKDEVGVVAGIDNHGFAGRLIAEYRAVALEHANRKGLDDHGFTLVAPRTFKVPAVAPGLLLMSVLAMSCSSPGTSFCRTTILSVSRILPVWSV